MRGSHGGRAEAVVERWDDVFRAVAAEPRRQLIVALLEAPPDDAVRFPEAAMNPNLDEDPETLRIELYHQHLPLLADLDFIRWSNEPLLVTRGPRFEEVAAVFNSIDRYATELPDELVMGCRHLETLQQ